MASSYITSYTTERGYSVDSEPFFSISLPPSLLLTLFLVQTGLFINNEFVGGSSQIELINPADGKPILKVEAGEWIVLGVLIHMITV